MVNIELLSKKLNDLFNGRDIENANSLSLSNEQYFFNVATAGYELKDVFDYKSGKNFIPVFVSAIGGTFNPVPNLKEYEMNCQVEIYFPVRFKEDFYGGFTHFLLNTLVAKKLTFDNGEQALCNVGVPQYGEIESVNVREFQNFVETIYKYPLRVSEQWMSMTFTLLIKGSDNEGYMLSNDVKFKVSYKGRELGETIIQSGVINYSSTPSSEQILGEKESFSIANTSATNYSLTVNIEKNNEVHRELISDLLTKNLQNNDLTLSIDVFGDDYINIDCYADSVSIPIMLGSSLQMTIVFNRKVEL